MKYKISVAAPWTTEYKSAIGPINPKLDALNSQRVKMVSTLAAGYHMPFQGGISQIRALGDKRRCLKDSLEDNHISAIPKKAPRRQVQIVWECGNPEANTIQPKGGHINSEDIHRCWAQLTHLDGTTIPPVLPSALSFRHLCHPDIANNEDRLDDRLVLFHDLVLASGPLSVTLGLPRHPLVRPTILAHIWLSAATRRLGIDPICCS